MASPSIVVFNEAYYLAQNPDVAAAVSSGAYSSGLQHWQAYGQSEGRLSSAFFDLQTYKDNNGDLNEEAGFVTDADYIRHFTTYGHLEQRVFLSANVFNADIYAAQNPDLAEAGITDRLALEQHFLRSGIYEGRVAKADFDPVAYINANADLKALLEAGGNINGYTQANISKAGWFHYLNFGIGEGRTAPVATARVTDFTIGAATVTEGNAATFTVKLAVPLTHDVTYTFNVTGDTKGGALNAASATDFGSVTGTVTIPAGSTSATFTITPTADGVSEGLEGFKVTLFDGSLNVVKTSDVVGIIDAAAPVTPKTITLTTAADAGTAFIGDTANDTFIGSFNFSGGGSDAATTTLTAGDSLVGGAGTDTLSISVAGSAGSASVTPTLIGIERISVASSHSGTAQFDLSLTDSALSSISVTSSVNAGSNLEFINLSKVVALDIKGAGNVKTTFATGVLAGTGDALAVTLNGVGSSGAASTLDFSQGVETLSLTSATAANYLTLGATGTSGAGGVSTVNVAGSQALTLNLAGTGITAVNASGLSAGLTLNSIGVANVTVTGGAGNDTFDFGTGLNATTQTGTGASQLDVVAGGAGTDTLKIAINNSDVADTVFGNVTSVETLVVTQFAGTGTGDVELGAKAAAAGIVTVTESTFSGSGDIGVTVGTGYTGTLTVNLADESNTNAVVNVAASGVANVVVNASVLALGTGGLTFSGSTGTGTTDTLGVSIGSGSILTGTVGANVTNLDAIVVTAASGASGAVLVLDNANTASGRTLSVNASALGSGVAFTLSGGAEINGKFSVTGGAGSDYIILGNGNDTVFGGAGNDTIDASSGGNDVLSGGAGNDLFILGNALSGNTGIIIDGGDGIDTLEVSSANLTSAMLAGVTNVENLVFSGDATLSSPIQFSSFDLSLGAASGTAGTLTLASGYTGATTVTLGSGDKVVNTGANVALSIHVTDVAYGTGSGLVIAGGSGVDTLYLAGASTGPSGGTATVVTLNAASNIEVITIVDAGDGTGTGATGAGKDVSLALATGYTKAVTVDASALDSGTSGLDETFTFDGSLSSGTVTVTGGAANDSITGSSGNDVLIGGAGDDRLVAGAGFDNVSGGDGNDTLVFGSTSGTGHFDGNDTVNGGSGTDTLSINQGTGTGGGIGDLAFLNVTNVERLALADADGVVTLDTRAQAAGIVTVALDATGSANVTVNAGGYSSGLSFLVGTNDGNVKLTGGAGNDSFTFAGASGLNASDSLVGGAGTDTVILSNGTGSGGTAFVGTLGAGVSGIEVITVADGATGTGSTAGVTLTLANGFNSGAAITVDASALNATGEVLSLTGASGYNGAITATGGAGADTIISSGTGADHLSGGAGSDAIDGGAGNDVLDGGAGDDVLTGGAGADTLTGGAGNDVFVITAGSSSSTGADVITDFASGDVVRLSLTGTGAITIDNSYKGSASSYANALSLLTGQSGTNAGQYVYVSDLNQLVIDVDGNGLLQGNDLYVTLQGTTGINTSTVALDYTVNTGSGTIIGGAASDKVTQSGTGALTLSGIEAYVGDAGTGIITLSGSQAITITDAANLVVTGSTGVDTITVSGVVAGHNYDLRAGNDTITFTSGVSTTSVTGGDGSDTITFSGTVATTAVFLGSGDDTITFSGQVTSASVSGGDGNDTLTFLSTGGNGGSTGVVVNGVETVYGSSGTDIIAIASGHTGTITVINASGLFGISGSADADVIQIGSGNAGTIVVGDAGGGITVSGTTGADAVIFVGTGATSSGVLDLGSGDDTVSLSGSSGSVTVSGGAGTDTLTFTSGSTVAATIIGIESVTGDTAVNTVTLGNTGNDFILLGSATGTGTTVSFSSWASGDVINLGTGGSASGGVDTIVFGSGFDTASGLTGLVFSGFDAGAATGDVLDIGILADGTTSTGFGTGSGVVLSTATGAASFDLGVVVSSTGLAFGDIGTGTGQINFSQSNGHIVLVATTNAATSFQVVLVDSSLDGTGSDWTSADLRILGTVNLAGSDTVQDLVSGNFIL